MPHSVSFAVITVDEAIRLAGVLAWPTVVVVLAIVFRRPLIALVEGIAGLAKGSLSKVSLPGGFAFELVRTSEFKIDWTGPGGQDLRNTVAVTQFASGVQDAIGLLKAPQASQAADYAIFVLGSGKKWLTSRLHLFSMLLRRTHGLRYCVFTCDTSEASGRYLGFASTEAVRWSMALRYPHLERAANQALLQLSDDRVVSRAGALDPQTATTFINGYLAAIQIDLEFSTASLEDNSAPAFATTLRQGTGLAAFLKSRLSPEALKEVNQQPKWTYQVSEVAKSLNGIVQEESLYDGERFSGVTLSEPTKRLVERKPEGDDRTLLNRLLLYDAFPQWVKPVTLPADFTSFNDGEWVKLETRDAAGNLSKRWEHARWLDRSYAEALLGAELGRAQVGMSALQAASRKDQVSLILRAEGPMVAVVGDGGRFVRLVDRLNLASRAMEFSL